MDQPTQHLANAREAASMIEAEDHALMAECMIECTTAIVTAIELAGGATNRMIEDRT